MARPKRTISPQRKGIYYTGMAICIIGACLFIGNFFMIVMRPDWDDPKYGGEGASSVQYKADSDSHSNWMVFRAFGGFTLLIIGGVTMNIGARGAAGSGLVLDPEQAKQDLEPWARTAGGLVKDALDESGVKLAHGGEGHQGEDLDFDEKLRKLHKLLEDGIISQEEFDKEKAETLDEN